MSESMGTAMVFWPHEGRWYGSKCVFDLMSMDKIPSAIHRGDTLHDVRSMMREAMVMNAALSRQVIVEKYPSSEPSDADVSVMSEEDKDVYYERLAAGNARRADIHIPWILQHAIFVDMPLSDPEVLRAIQDVVLGITV